jgi:transcriptional regulator with XRE-family HTH domain
MERGLNQSELARRAEVGRDSISTYIRGRSFPEPKALAKVARALGVIPQELLPNTIAAALDSDKPSVEIKESSGNPGKMWMSLNRLVTTKQALQIMQILQNAVEEDKGQQGDIFS